MSLEGDTIRVALENCGDAAEYRRTENGWIAEGGDSVEIEFHPLPQSEPPAFPLTASLERSTAEYCVV